MQMQEFDLDEYMEGGIEGSETLNFDLDNNAPCGPRFLEPNYYLAASSAQIPLSYQLGNLQPSVGIESHTLGPYAHTAASSTTDVGAGPFPHSHGTQLATGSGNPVTDFTKRRDWAHRVIEELRDFLYILSPDGRLLYVSPSITSLTGYAPQDVVGKLISYYIHHDDANLFGREFNESIASGKPLRFFYRFRKKDGTYAIFEAHGHPHFTSEAAPLGQNAGASFCCGFFMMSRPYPTKNAALLDSFLEHKIENARLRKRIADLRREEQEDLEGQQQQWLDRRGSESTVHSQSPYPQIQHEDARASRDYDGMPPPKKPSVANNALTRQNLDEALAKSDPDSLDDKMARYERPHHFETIEMLTGLRYRDGERSKGISTGAASPTLTHGDAGIAMQFEEDGRYRQGFEGYEDHSHGDIHCSDKRKRVKVADEHVCTDCGTLDSPEWRKGPTGPKTLCNACGLRWAKKEKKRIGPSIEVAPNHGNAESSAPPAGAKGMMPPETT